MNKENQFNKKYEDISPEEKIKYLENKNQYLEVKNEYLNWKEMCIRDRLPPKDLMERFEKQVVLMKKQIDELAIANSNLIKQRDLLLPRLMSGKLEVK